LKVLIIDNKDSFTYNLKHYINCFCDHVDVVRYNRVNINNVRFYDKILFSPGPGLPNEYLILNQILRRYGSCKSILGVCLGQQAIVQFYGGRLRNLIDPLHGCSSKVRHFNNCVLYKDIPISFQIGHYHSWVVSRYIFPRQLEITSVNESNLIMSIKHKKYDVRAVQFHPESILTEYGIKLLKNWLYN